MAEATANDAAVTAMAMPVVGEAVAAIRADRHREREEGDEGKPETEAVGDGGKTTTVTTTEIITATIESGKTTATSAITATVSAALVQGQRGYWPRQERMMREAP